MSVVAAAGLTKRFGEVTALDDVTFTLTGDKIYGLLGRNGAGKTTLMQLITGQNSGTSGDLMLFGERPYENERVLSRVVFIKESQTYPTAYQVRHVLSLAKRLFPNWDEDFAQSLVDDFDLPRKRKVRKLSRGMLSALGVTIGLAARAPLTFFDEPYLGLDAVARQLFYDRLLADYAENPRTVVLSTHLIDEVADLIEHVLLLDRGKLLLDAPSDELRGEVVEASGPAAAVDEFAAAHQALHREQLGGAVRASLRGSFDDAERTRAKKLGIDLAPVSLQQAVVRLTTERTNAR
ncbi:ATP-binding cassette domain-containing protein [Micromonospora chalcea]|uniref:ABC transporter ATP-binding protein n=1 Tax=Micromonospora chalcea TaxID=1874 RepID=A0ABX9YA66_MICCH|nr:MULTISPECIES: ABC transporter ATP-binding protein [Micromonospora]EWM67617.1 ABC transporter ATP-binding protein [Micromonospora sp. M42]MBP1785535.1 ABC-2 type transport system ATP-binding protein [Micromonospora sp. HB375]MBQ1053762.1 ABC transporter ATP-binding protein [Micromonospora sp. C32]MCK1809179.1 ABC transporter ATP-binding protein [Micromonospora sp. R42106]MCK1833784.1 ABC transporter ATP-binding protein [Micromonospora sp. R42003]